ncbi:MAG: leucine-rich repeat protein [Lachnospiraceae bacterium]
MRKERLKKRGIALSLACVMILSMFTGIKANAGWWGNPEENPETAKQYGLWFGSCWLEEDENSENCGKWMMDTDEDPVVCDPTSVDVGDMREYADMDLREVDGTWKNAYFFKYVDYEISGEVEESSINIGNIDQITEETNLYITYLGTELENDAENEGNTDPRWAIANVVEDSSASITPIEESESEGLFELHIEKPGYYIISKGQLEIADNHFIDSDAAIGLHVYKYTGLAAREAYYDGDSQQWNYDPEDPNYGNEIWGRDLGDSAFAITDVVEGEEGSISFDELELTYYGEIGADPRFPYETTDEAEQPIEKYEEKVDTKATIEVYNKDESLILFKPDTPGKYLISKKGITDEVTDENREIRENAILIDVDSNRPGFFNTTKYLRENLLFNVWADCYDTTYVEGQADSSFYYHAPVVGEEEDAFEKLIVNYGDNTTEIGKDEIISNGFSDVLSMEPVSGANGWYKITINLNDYMHVEFVDSFGGCANLDVRYYGANEIELREVDREKTAYSYMDDPYLVTTSFTMEAYGVENGELKKITSEDKLAAFNVYERIELGDICWEDENGEPQHMEGFSHNENDELIYENDPDDVRFIFGEDEDGNEILEYVYKKVDSDNASIEVIEEGLKVQVNAIGDYLLTSENGGWYEFRADLPSIGVYNTPERKEYNRDYIDNLEKNIKVYQGRDCSDTYYVLAWVDKDHYDKNGEPVTGNVNEWDNLSPWAADPDTIDIQAGENVNFKTLEDVDFDSIEGFVKVDTENPVIYEDEDNRAKIGYPIQLTNDIDRDFSIIMSAERNNTELKRRYDALAVDYEPLKELKVKNAPTKVEYIEGETFDPSGLVVEAVYEDGTSFTLSKDEYKLTVSDKLSTNDKVVTISYLEKTVNQNITVKAKQKVDLSKAAWNYKEAFIADGTEKTVEITGLPADAVNIEYKNNKASAAGTYTAEAVITLKDANAYEFSGEIPASLKSLTWEIKAPVTTPADPTTVGETTVVENATFKVLSTEEGKKAVTYVSGDKNAAKVTIPATVTVNGNTYAVTEIADNAFSGNKKLTTVSIPDSVTKIGKNAFKNCAKLKSVTIPAEVTEIGSDAFSGCKKLTKVTIGKNVTTIGDKAFYNCSALTKVTIPANVSKIGKQTFAGCKNLKSITIKTTKLTSKNVGSNAFKGINAKATIKVPKSKLSSYKKLLKSKGVSSKAKITK